MALRPSRSPRSRGSISVQAGNGSTWTVRSMELRGKEREFSRWTEIYNMKREHFLLKRKLKIVRCEPDKTTEF